jgi:threonyl-tRNA synthetase
MYSLLEKAAFDQKTGKVPKLPLWLAPTQVRVIPISEEQTKYAEKVTDELIENNIRADIDDRPLHVGKKIRAGEIEWCPFIVVVGEKEQKAKNINVRERQTKKQSSSSVKKLVDEIKKKTEGMPFKPLPLPKELSKRPIFVG